MQGGAPHKSTFVCLDAAQLLLHSVGAGTRSNPYHVINAETVLERARRADSLRFHSPAPACIQAARSQQQQQNSDRAGPIAKRPREEKDGTASDHGATGESVPSPFSSSRIPHVIARELDEVELLAPFSTTVQQRWRESGLVVGGADISERPHAPWLSMSSAVQSALDGGQRDVPQARPTSGAHDVTQSTPDEAGESSGTVLPTESGVDAVADATPSWCVHLHPCVLQRQLFQALLILQQPGRSQSAGFFLNHGFGFQRSSGEETTGTGTGTRVVHDACFSWRVLPGGISLEDDDKSNNNNNNNSNPADEERRRLTQAYIARGGYGYCVGERASRAASASQCSRSTCHDAAAVVGPPRTWHCWSLGEAAQGDATRGEVSSSTSSHDASCVASWHVVEMPMAATTAALRGADTWQHVLADLVAPHTLTTELDEFLTEGMIPRLYSYIPTPTTTTTTTADASSPSPWSSSSPSTTNNGEVVLAAVYQRPLHSFVQRQSFVSLSYLAHLSWCRWVAACVCRAVGRADTPSASASKPPMCCHYRLCLCAASRQTPFALAQIPEWTSFLVFTDPSSAGAQAGSVALVVRVDDCQRTLTWRRGVREGDETGSLVTCLRTAAAIGWTKRQ